jgi:hypothetical protein
MLLQKLNPQDRSEGKCNREKEQEREEIYIDDK